MGLSVLLGRLFTDRDDAAEEIVARVVLLPGVDEMVEVFFFGVELPMIVETGLDLFIGAPVVEDDEGPGSPRVARRSASLKAVRDGLADDRGKVAIVTGFLIVREVVLTFVVAAAELIVFFDAVVGRAKEGNAAVVPEFDGPPSFEVDIITETTPTVQLEIGSNNEPGESQDKKHNQCD